VDLGGIPTGPLPGTSKHRPDRFGPADVGQLTSATGTAHLVRIEPRPHLRRGRHQLGDLIAISDGWIGLNQPIEFGPNIAARRSQDCMLHVHLPCSKFNKWRGSRYEQL
jgi:hypothetical protein